MFCGMPVSVPLPKFCEKLLPMQNFTKIGQSAAELWPKTIFAVQARLMSSCGVSVCVCLFVCHVREFCQNESTYIFFSPSGSHTIVVFPYQTAWQYSDGNPSNSLTGASNAGGVGRNRDSEPISGGFTACCQSCDWPSVINTSPLDHGKL